MKRLATMMTCIVLLIVPTAWQAYAVELSLNAVTVERGGSAVLELNLGHATEAYAGVNATLKLPAGVTLAGIAKGDLLTGNFILDYGSDTNIVIANSSTDTADGDGNLLKLQVQVDSNTPTGSYPITLEHSGLSNVDGSVSVAHVVIAGTLMIVDVAPDPATLREPVGALGFPPSTFVWDESPAALSYTLSVRNDDSSWSFTDSADAGAICEAGVCSMNLPQETLLAPDSYVWQVEAINTHPDSAVSEATFKIVPAPVLISPLDQIFGVMPAFTWQAVDMAEVQGYDLEISDHEGSVFSGSYQAAAICSGSTCEVQPEVTLPSGRYTWRVQPNGASYEGGPWSEQAVFALLLEPSGLKPSGVLSAPPTEFRWDAAGSDVVTAYDLDLVNAYGPVFSRPYDPATVCAGAVCSAPAEVVLPDNTYTWTLMVSAADGYTTQSVATFTLNTGFVIPAPVLLSPAGEAVDPSPEYVAYAWEAVHSVEVEAYHLEIYDGANARLVSMSLSPQDVCSPTECTFSPEVSPGFGAYTWRVRVSGAYGYGPWSDSQAFTVVLPPITVKKAGSGNGTLTIGALICDESCQEINIPYVEGAQYAITVGPDRYSQFIEWQDANGIWIENLFYAQPGDTVYAVFERFAPITVRKSGSGIGTVVIDGQTCDISCQELTVAYVNNGQFPMAVATADPSSYFSGWQDNAGSALPDPFSGVQPGAVVYAVFEHYNTVRILNGANTFCEPFCWFANARGINVQP